MGTTTTEPRDKKKVQVLADFVNSDLNKPRDEYVFRTPGLVSALEGLLIDKRDLPMLCLQLNIMEYLFVGVACIYYINMMANPLPLYVRNLLGFAYVLTNLLTFQERFILMMHYESHRPIFNRKYGFLNCYVRWVLTPFYGIPCGVYKIHHCIMHHIENNHDLDISSTEIYQRDTLSGFLMYYFRFAGLIIFELPLYCIKTKRWQWLKIFLTGLCVWAGSIAVLAKFVSFWATFWVFILPYFIAFFAMSFGNFSQHIFIDPTRPESNYALTYNCIDTWVNQRTFNDGYHVIHHYNSGMHWSELAEHFHSEAAQTKHIAEGALTFRGLSFFDVGIYVMTGRLNRLADHYVHLGSRDTAPTLAAIEVKMRSWLQKIPAVKAKKLA